MKILIRFSRSANQISRKSVQLERAEGGTDVTKLVATFRNFANAP